MRREHGKAGASGLVLLGSPKSPESNGTATKLGEPALKLGLSSIMGQTRHVQNLAPLRKERSDICPGIHWPSQDIRVILRGLRLADQTTQNAGQGDGLLHGATGRGGSQSLQMERQVVLDGRTRLHRLHLESRADVGEHRGPKGQRLGMVLLPSLIFSSQVEGAGVLQIGRQHDGLVAGFARELNSEVPGVKGDEDEVEVFRSQILGSKRVEAGDGIPKGTSVSDMFPRQSRQTRCEQREKQSTVSPSFRQYAASLEILKTPILCPHHEVRGKRGK